jgi:hypothetical protein
VFEEVGCRAYEERGVVLGLAQRGVTGLAEKVADAVSFVAVIDSEPSGLSASLIPHLFQGPRRWRIGILDGPRCSYKPRWRARTYV